MATLLTSNRVFLGYGLSVVAWAGNKGWVQLTEAKELIKRTEYCSSSIVAVGSFQMIESPGSAKWPLLLPGDMGKLLCPDFVPGKYAYAAMQDGSLEYCVASAGTSGIPDLAPFESREVRPGTIKVPYRHVLIVATGELLAKGRSFKAPYIIPSKSMEGYEGVMTGRGMLCYRPT
jgi:hypothetical protein